MSGCAPEPMCGELCVPRRCRARFAAAALCCSAAAVFEGALIWVAAAEHLPLEVGLAVYLAAVLAAALWWSRARRSGANLCLPTIILFLAGFLGPLGYATAALICALRAAFGCAGEEAGLWLAELGRQAGSSQIPFSWQSGGDQDLREEDVLPMRDVMVSGNVRDKQAALSKLARNFNPSFAPLLQRALDDGSNAVRVQAASALCRLGMASLSRIMQLESRAARAGCRPEAVLELAEEYRCYAASGLLDQPAQRQMEVSALSCYRRYLAQRPGDELAKIAGSGLLLRAGRAEEVCGLLDGAWRHTAERKLAVLMLYLEGLFMRGRFQQMRAVIKDFFEEYPAEAIPSDQAYDALSVWINAEQA